MKSLFTLVIIVLTAMSTIGCATLLKGYEDTVTIHNAPAALQIYSKDGVEIPIVRKKKLMKTGVVNVGMIRLRSNRDHTLTLKKEGETAIVTLYPRLGFGWVVLDILCGGIPSLYDAYTGNWNTFADIESTF